MPNTRDSSFVPLTPAAASTGRRADMRVVVLSKAENARPFQPGQSVGAHAHDAHGSAAEPRVTVKRDGDRVTGIQVQCGCGRMIELACVYEPAAGQS